MVVFVAPTPTPSSNPKPETFLKPETRIPKSETLDTKPGTRNPKLETVNPPFSRNLKPSLKPEPEARILKSSSNPKYAISSGVSNKKTNMKFIKSATKFAAQNNLYWQYYSICVVILFEYDRFGLDKFSHEITREIVIGRHRGFSKSETRIPKSETLNTKSGTQNPKLETRNPEPETRNTEPSTRNPDLRILPDLKTRIPEFDIRRLEPRKSSCVELSLPLRRFRIHPELEPPDPAKPGSRNRNRKSSTLFGFLGDKN